MTLVDEQAVIVQNTCEGPGLYLMELEAPQIAEAVQPGQFVHLRQPLMEAHLLRRPFSVYAHDIAKGTIEILYQVVGTGTKHMATQQAGTSLSLIGPAGRPWHPLQNARRALLVGGGVGAAPLYMLAEALLNERSSVDLVLGAQTDKALVCRGRFEELLGFEARCSTDDGSYGRPGFCTSLVCEALTEAQDCGTSYDYVAACGPEPLMHAVADMAKENGILCEVSMERRMACGIGACLSCVVDTKSGKKRTCADGPVFDAGEIIW